MEIFKKKGKGRIQKLWLLVEKIRGADWREQYGEYAC